MPINRKFICVTMALVLVFTSFIAISDHSAVSVGNGDESLAFPATSSSQISFNYITNHPVLSGPNAIVSYGSYTYVASLGGKAVSVFDGTAYEGYFGISGEANGLAVAPYGTGAYLLISDYSGNLVLVYDLSSPASPSFQTQIQVGAGPAGITFDSSNGYVYVSDSTGSQITYFPFETISPYPITTSTFNTGTNPEWIEYDPTDGYIYALNEPSSSAVISVLSVGSSGIPSVYKTLNFGSNLALTYDSYYSSIVAASTTEVYLIGQGSIASQYSASIGGTISAISQGPEGDILISNEADSNLQIYVPGVGLSSASVPGGSYHGVGYDSSTSDAYLSDYSDNTIYIIGVTFTYQVTFEETGLQSGVTWSVTLNGVTQSSSGSSITFAESIGTFSYSVNAPSGYTASPSGAQISVPGTSPIMITFSSITAAVTFAVNGVGSTVSGTLLTVGGISYSVTNVPLTFQWAVGSTHSFAWITTMGSGTSAEYIWKSSSGLSTQSSGSITVLSGGGSITASYSPLYLVSFAVSPSGDGTLTWSVGGSTAGSTQTSYSGDYYPAGQQLIVSAQPNPNYDFVGWSSSNQNLAISNTGSISTTATIKGPGIITADFSTLQTYKVTFTESTLPSGVSWSVDMGGQTESSTGSAIVFQEPQGLYSYSISAPSGYVASPVSGQINVPVTSPVNITFIKQGEYQVTFDVQNLAPGTFWSVTLNGSTKTSFDPSIAFAESPGTYIYSINPPSGYFASPSSGQISVSGALGVKTTLFLLAGYYSVSFIESGLTAASTWSVFLNGVTESSSATTITFAELSGEYSYSVNPPPLISWHYHREGRFLFPGHRQSPLLLKIQLVTLPLWSTMNSAVNIQVIPQFCYQI